jgi:hypothetical protein
VCFSFFLLTVRACKCIGRLSWPSAYSSVVFGEIGF